MLTVLGFRWHTGMQIQVFFPLSIKIHNYICIYNMLHEMSDIYPDIKPLPNVDVFYSSSSTHMMRS